jgi:hypothetical protein
LTCRADAGDQDAAYQLALLLGHRGDEAELSRRADAGDQPAADRLAELLVARGARLRSHTAPTAVTVTPPPGWLGCSASVATRPSSPNAPRRVRSELLGSSPN